ncbi:MAG TPA: thiamine pyrophosphate-dependent enzyme [Kofleriaceae bacterium]|nr:thiamine pyrophosphate-dependent enzyme [Kofleriaceae bacterium]
MLRAILAAVRSASGAMFVGNGANARVAHALDDAPWVFYMMGSMGMCAPLAAGFSRFAGRPVVAVEGDGNAVMGLSGLPVVAAAARPPFLHIVLDNGTYETTGGQRVLAPDLLFVRAAGGAGYDPVRDIAGMEELADALERGLVAEQVGFLRVRIEPDTAPLPPRVRYSPEQIPPRFIAACRPRDGASRTTIAGGDREHDG